MKFNNIFQFPIKLIGNSIFYLVKYVHDLFNLKYRTSLLKVSINRVRFCKSFWFLGFQIQRPTWVVFLAPF